MSFDEQHDLVQKGDTVILYLGHNSMHQITVAPPKVHQTKFGAFPHSELIGKKFGAKIYSKNRKGWIYLLYPTPELWSLTVPHRTQILYTTDISIITMELELKPGSAVIESGTGSGSLSHAMIRTIKPTGHLYTFDFHQQRTEKAQMEFKDHGIGKYVTTECRDVCKEGFGLSDLADAVFLDLPKPWEVIPFAKQSLKKSGGRLCSFSPCIEQVQKSCQTLAQQGFCEIKTIECLTKALDVRTVAIGEPNFGPTIENTDTICKESRKRKLEDTEDKTTISKQSDVTEGSEPDKTENTKLTGVDSKGMVTKFVAKQKTGNINVLTARPVKEIPGHTGYLTFATLFPHYDH